MAPREKGQALVMTLVTLPLFILITGLSLRSGKTMITHQKVTSHCDYVVLEALRIEANALQALGKINLVARKIIDSRRAVDAAIEAAMIAPVFEPELIETRTALIEAQKLIAARQKFVIHQAELQTFAFTQREVTMANAGPVRWEFTPKPHAPFQPGMPQIKLHAVTGYEGETGAPLQLAPLPNQALKYLGGAVVTTEKFLPRWRGLSKSDDMKLNCAAKIGIRDLEGPWTINLVNADNL